VLDEQFVHSHFHSDGPGKSSSILYQIAAYHGDCATFWE
jgi:hypothetical protein